MINFELKDLHIAEEVLAAEDGRISIINIFEGIEVTNTPIIIPKFVVLAKVCGPEGKHIEKISIINPVDGMPVATAQGEIEIKDERGGNNFRARFLNTLFKAEGQYWIKISIGGQVLSDKNEHYVMVKKKIK